VLDLGQSHDSGSAQNTTTGKVYCRGKAHGSASPREHDTYLL